MTKGWPSTAKADVAEKCFVENLVHGLAVVDCAMRFADYARARSGCLQFRHWGTDSGKRQGWMKGKCNREDQTPDLGVRTSDYGPRNNPRLGSEV